MYLTFPKPHNKSVQEKKYVCLFTDSQTALRYTGIKNMSTTIQQTVLVEAFL